MTTVTFLFTGRLKAESFVEFARHRAARLALDAGPAECSQDGISITVTGDGDLVDAFEVACTLGPLDCLVEDVARSSVPDESGRA